MKKQTLIINYPGMRFGGIESYFSKLMEYSLEQQYRIIWITTERCVANSQFKSVTDDDRIEKIINNSKLWVKVKPVHFDVDEQITMLSCDPLQYLGGEEIRKFLPKGTHFSHLLLIPHFTEAVYYPERFFYFPIIKRHVFHFFKKMIVCLNNDKLIFGFSLIHLDNYEKNYGITVAEKTNHVLKAIIPRKSFDLENALAKAGKRSEYFEIITCGRFDFPHKGYMIGLVKAYSILKRKYNQIILTYIGDGPSRSELEKVIDILPESEKKDIKLLGYVSPDNTQEFFKKATIVVGLSGALVAAARCGLPSIRVRHYCYDCEAYDFIGAMDQTKWDEQGTSIIPFIERMIICPDEEYVNQAQRDFNKTYEDYEYDPGFLFKQKQYLNNSFSRSFIRCGRLINLLKVLKLKFFHKVLR